MDNRRPKPSLYDWSLLAIGTTFVAIGVVLLPSQPDVAIVTLALFGSCTALFAWQIWRKLRYRKFSASRVSVVGGIPIRPSKVFGWGLALWLIALGLTLYIFGTNYPAPFRWLSLAVTAAGSAVLLAVITGRFPSGYLQFDPDGLTIDHRRWRARIPWSAISEVIEAEINSNPVLLIAVNDLKAVTIEPPQAAETASNTITKNRSWLGTEFFVMASHYLIDLPTLSATVRRYAHEPSARAELTKALPVSSQER